MNAVSRLMKGNTVQTVTMRQRTKRADSGPTGQIHLHSRATSGGAVSNTAKLAGTASFVHRDTISS